MKEAATKRVDRIGVVATDTLRVLGLQSILPQFEVVHLTAPGALDDGDRVGCDREVEHPAYNS